MQTRLLFLRGEFARATPEEHECCEKLAAGTKAIAARNRAHDQCLVVAATPSLALADSAAQQQAVVRFTEAAAGVVDASAPYIEEALVVGRATYDAPVARRCSYAPVDESSIVRTESAVAPWPASMISDYRDGKGI